jgi:hypothetical protein
LQTLLLREERVSELEDRVQEQAAALAALQAQLAEVQATAACSDSVRGPQERQALVGGLIRASKIITRMKDDETLAD